MRVLFRFFVLFTLAFLPGCIGCGSCLRNMVAADPPVTVLNDISWAPEISYKQMSARYRRTHTQVAFQNKVLALPHVREMAPAGAHAIDLDYGDRVVMVSGELETTGAATVPFTAKVVVEDEGHYACDALVIAGVNVE